MAAGLDELVTQLKYEPTSVPSPDGEPGHWQQLFSRFGRHGFVRCLVEPSAQKMLCHFAVPGWDEQRSGALVSGLSAGANRWYAGKLDGAHALHAEIRDDWGQAVLLAARLGDFADSNEGADRVLLALLGDKKNAAETSQDVQENKPTAAPAAFEEIGAVEVRHEDSPAVTPALRVHPRGAGFHVVLQLGHELSVSESENTARAVRRQLRSFLDVDVEILPAASRRAVELEVRAADWAEGLSQESLEAGIVRHLKGLLDVAERGVSPAAFLGLEAPPAASTSVSTHSRPSSSTPEPKPRLEPAPSQAEVVFSMPNRGALKPGDFEDARLGEPDALGALVDVVLRHPGYSDRRVGQVLSILLSVEYHAALRLMQSAPVVIARGVARDRALTMREVITGAGGKVQLSEPGFYPEA